MLTQGNRAGEWVWNRNGVGKGYQGNCETMDLMNQ